MAVYCASCSVTSAVRLFAEPQQGLAFDQEVTAALAAEAAGMAGYWRSDHFLRIGVGSSAGGPSDVLVSLAALARETTSIRIGALVFSATFRLPGLLAVGLTQLDVISGGRVDVGLGAGWYEAEHKTHGVAFPPTKERFERLEEQLEILTKFWRADGATFSFAGRHYVLEDCPALPRPAQRPSPPVVVGGVGHVRTPRLAARFATEFNVPPVGFTAAEAWRCVGRVHAACRAIGRDPSNLRTSVTVPVCCGTTEESVATLAGRARLAPEGRGAAIGGPRQVVDALRRYLDVGFDALCLQVEDVGDLTHLGVVTEAVASELER